MATQDADRLDVGLDVVSRHPVVTNQIQGAVHVTREDPGRTDSDGRDATPPAAPRSEGEDEGASASIPRLQGGRGEGRGGGEERREEGGGGTVRQSQLLWLPLRHKNTTLIFFALPRLLQKSLLFASRIRSKISHKQRQKVFALAGSRTRIYCLEGNNANHYTTNARPEDRLNNKAFVLHHNYRRSSSHNLQCTVNTSVLICLS